VRSVGAYEAKTHLSQLLDDVARGETIAITKHGVTVAVLAPPVEARHRDAAAAVERWRRYRDEQGITLGSLSIRDLIDNGRM
jgi:prevent-host-death family protein